MCWLPWTQTSATNKTWRAAKSPSWFFSRPPTVSTIFANTFPPACGRSRKSSLGKLSKSAVKSECLGGLSFSASSSWLPDYGSLMTARLRRMAQAKPAFSGICGARDGKKLRGLPIVARLKLVSLTIGVWTLACHKEQGHSFPRQVSNGGTHHD